MAENIGEATVRISADITPLQQAVAKVKATTKELKGMEGFKVDWGEGAGSIKEYNEYIKQATDEFERFGSQAISAEEALKRAGITSQQTAEQTEQVATAEQTYNQALETTASILASNLNPLQAQLLNNLTPLADRMLTLKTSVTDFAGSVSGQFASMKTNILESNRITRTALIGLSASLIALGKSGWKELGEYSETAKEQQEQMAKSMSKIKATIGQLVSPIVGAVGSIADFATKNTALIQTFYTMALAIGGSAGLIALVKKLGTAFAILKQGATGIVGVLGGLVGLIGAFLFPAGSMSQTLEEITEEEKRQKEATEALDEAYKDYTSTMADVNQQIAEIQEQMAKSTRDYRRSLKQLLVDHEATIGSLTEQIRDANDDYQRAIDERNASFAVSQAKEAEEHQKKVDELMTQINFLQRYNNKYNQEKLSQLQFALAKENRLYQERTEAEKAELEVQNENERKARDKKLAEYQAELNEEVAFMNKHRQALEAVRNEILLDEVESLDEQYREQMASYQKQIESARKKGMESALAYAEAYTDTLNRYDWNGKYKTLQQKLGEAFGSVWGEDGGYLSREKAMRGGQEVVLETFLPGAFEDGGYTGRGGKNEIAGVVHRGEYVLPQEQVDQTTGQPKLGNTNITINLSGTFATSEAEKRSVAQQIANALQQVQRQRLGA